MTFTLEALRAKHGDALLLHFGSEPDPRLLVIDGGPAGVFTTSLRPRLDQLRRAGEGGGCLPIRLLMVSHIDDDHIRGVLDLAETLVEAQDSRSEPDWKVMELWHNSFDDLVGRDAEALRGASVAAVGAASLEGEIGDDLPVSRPAALVLASVPQGRRLRDAARVLGLPVNASGNGGAGRLIAAHAGAPAVSIGGGLVLQVVAPRQDRLTDLQHTWTATAASLHHSGGLATPAARAEAADYVDTSVYNLSSIVVLAELGGQTMLLTGDARGDDILSGLEQAALLSDGALHVDLLKLPHHGSDRDVEVDLFRRITADHYVVSGDGSNGNPEPGTFEMIFTARGPEPFTLHMTYAPEDLKDPDLGRELRQLFDRQHAAGSSFEVRAPGPGELSVAVALQPSDGA